MLVFRRRDRSTIVPALPVERSPALWDLPVDARTASLDGAARRLHLLVAGATRAGKGPVIWSAHRGVAACVHEGR